MDHILSPKDFTSFFFQKKNIFSLGPFYKSENQAIMILKSSVNEFGAELILGARIHDNYTHALFMVMLSTGSFYILFLFLFSEDT